MRRGDALWADVRREEAAHHAKTQALIEEFARRGEEERQLNREILRRNEIVMRELLDVTAGVKEELRQLKQASEAHTKAIFALIDRLGKAGARERRGRRRPGLRRPVPPRPRLCPPA